MKGATRSTNPDEASTGGPQGPKRAASRGSRARRGFLTLHCRHFPTAPVGSEPVVSNTIGTTIIDSEYGFNDRTYSVGQQDTGSVRSRGCRRVRRRRGDCVGTVVVD